MVQAGRACLHGAELRSRRQWHRHDRGGARDSVLLEQLAKPLLVERLPTPVGEHASRKDGELGRFTEQAVGNEAMVI